MLQRLASAPAAADVAPEQLVELEAGFAPLEAAFTQPTFLARLLRRLSAAAFTELFADGGGATLTAVLRWGPERKTLYPGIPRYMICSLSGRLRPQSLPQPYSLENLGATPYVNWRSAWWEDGTLTAPTGSSPPCKPCGFAHDNSICRYICDRLR